MSRPPVTVPTGAERWQDFGDPWPRVRTQARVLRTNTELLYLWRKDILAWCFDTLHQLPRDWQPAILAAIAAVLWSKGDVSIAIAACRGAGKSRAAAIIALWFLTTRKNSLVMFLAPVWSQVYDSLWTEIRMLWANSIWPQLRPDWKLGETPRIKTGWPDWRAIGIASNRVQNLESRHAPGGVCIILDEGKAINDDIRESVDGMLHRFGVESLLVTIGTPGAPLGFFYRAFADDRAHWDLQIRVRSLDIPSLRKRALLRRERLGPDNPWYLMQEEAEFVGADEFTVLPYNIIAQAIDAPIPDNHNYRRGIALDPAGRGADESVLMKGTGPIMRSIQAWQGWDEMQTAGHTAKEARAFRPEFVILDEIGLGAGIRSRVAELLSQKVGRGVRRRGDIRVVGYNAGHKARDSEQYENRKAEDLFALRMMLEDGELSIPNNAMLIQQWAAYRFKASAKGRTMIEDPEDSPDYGDCGVMLYAGMAKRAPMKGQRVSWI